MPTPALSNQPITGQYRKGRNEIRIPSPRGRDRSSSLCSNGCIDCSRSRSLWCNLLFLLPMKHIASALVKAQKEFGPALKRAVNPQFERGGKGGRYADLAACVEAVVDALNNNGIMLMQQNSECSDGVIVETVFIHESGETLSSGKLHVPSSKRDPQGYGSALTYARRYSLMAACGIAPEDDDGNSAVKAIQEDRKDDTERYEDEKFETKYLDKLRGAAMEGLAVLEAEWKSIPVSDAKGRFWARNQKSLKDAAIKGVSK